MAKRKPAGAGGPAPLGDNEQPLSARFLRDLDEALKNSDVGRPEDNTQPSVSVGALRRSRGRLPDTVRTATLVESDGVLTWEPGLVSAQPPLRRGLRRGQLGAPALNVVKQVRFEELPVNEITKLWDKLDDTLTPPNKKDGERGLLQWKDGKLQRAAAPPAGQALLVVHGTFSNSQNFFDAFVGTADGRNFLEAAKTRYPAGVYAFDHPTLGATPLENAVDLARSCDGSTAEFSVLTHSRGGLVTRWWREVLRPELASHGRVVFVGAPLAGTSLASPPRWKALMDYLTNLANVLETAGGVISLSVPCATVATTLLKAFGAATGFVAHSPLADAVVALIPGLNGQSRVGNQPGLRRLRAATTTDGGNYFSIQSNFEPPEVGWKFWRIFNRPLDRTLDAAADALFGKDEQNDLVVDVQSMSDLRSGLEIPADRRLDFGTNPNVHHVNYFQFPRTYEKLNQWLIATS